MKRSESSLWEVALRLSYPQVVAPLRDSRALAKEARKHRKGTAGRGWFDLPATQITDEVP